MAACTGAGGTMSVAWLMQISEGTDQVFSPFIMESMFFLPRYFSIVPCGPLSMRVWWPFQKNRTCIPFFGSGYAGLGMKSRLRTGGTSECAVIQALTQFLIG